MTENNKYQNGKIYKITDFGYNKCYVGSTVQQLSVRMGGHRRDYRMFLQGKQHYTTSFSLFEEFGVENCKIELVENFPCETKEQLLKKEGEYIKSLDCVNRCIAGRNQQQYREENKELVKEKKHASYLKHKEQVCEKSRDYYNLNATSCKEQQRLYREQKKETISERQRKKTECPKCKACIRQYELARHQQRKKCMASQTP